MSAKHVLDDAVQRDGRLPLWITYLWQRRYETSRLGIVLGAGVSIDAQCPMWKELVERLRIAAKVPENLMKRHRKAQLPETFLAEIVFRRHQKSEAKANSHLPAKHQRVFVNASWREKIHKCLYQDIKQKKFSDILSSHPYLESLAKLVYAARFAVTFNFDDIVDEAVMHYVSSLETRANSNPEIIFQPKLETRKDAPVIYHINGILPREELRRSSENVILTEDAFADILLSPNSFDAEYVINHFSVRTFLLLGISMSDNSLKNLLRSAAKRNPANHHFIIYHEEDGKRRSDEERQDIFEVNLQVYNLVSIFLTTKEIGAFIDILNAEDGPALDTALQPLAPGRIDRKYYLVGSVAAGKSSILEGLRCFTTHEEWTGRPPAAMYQDDKTLTKAQQKQVDDFLYPQLSNKNRRMSRDHSGIRVMDRAFLDLFAFSKGDAQEVQRKARELKNHIKNWGKPLESGHIFFLTADDAALEERLARRGVRKPKKQKTRKKGGKRVTASPKKIPFNVETLRKQEGQLKKIYRPSPAATFDTSDLSIGDAAKEIARKILLEDYAPFDFEKRLSRVIKRGGKI